ncbi:MAG: hypothetical protein E7558_04630 [Ruminococcaceae bacterium]|nr:hypothetical protein [Oscillospiraceae bacterium]MBQ6872804.1 hypothetical protein [Clostridia bacterium]
MKQKLIDGNAYSKVCENCFNGRMTADGQSVLCVRNGVMRPDSTCRKYKYDPLKRRPRRPHIAGGFTEEDFTL